MTAFAIIPFRKGSKGLPNKNILQIAGRRLWEWSYVQAENSGLRCIVTTDYEKVPASCPVDAEWVPRPSELATDDASLDDALIHAIDEIGLCGDDIVVTLQPTVPIREPGLIEKCVRCFDAFPAAKSLLTVNALHFVWAGDAGMLLNGPRVNRQVMSSGQKLYEEDGSVFVCRAGDLRKHRSRIIQPVILMETRRTVDIDTEDDFMLAEFLLEKRISR